MCNNAGMTQKIINRYVWLQKGRPNGQFPKSYQQIDIKVHVLEWQSQTCDFNPMGNFLAELKWCVSDVVCKPGPVTPVLSGKNGQKFQQQGWGR